MHYLGFPSMEYPNKTKFDKKRSEKGNRERHTQIYAENVDIKIKNILVVCVLIVLVLQLRNQFTVSLLLLGMFVYNWSSGKIIR